MLRILQQLLIAEKSRVDLSERGSTDLMLEEALRTQVQSACRCSDPLAGTIMPSMPSVSSCCSSFDSLVETFPAGASILHDRTGA